MKNNASFTKEQWQKAGEMFLLLFCSLGTLYVGGYVCTDEAASSRKLSKRCGGFFQARKNFNKAMVRNERFSLFNRVRRLRAFCPRSSSASFFILFIYSYC